MIYLEDMAKFNNEVSFHNFQQLETRTQEDREKDYTNATASDKPKFVQLAQTTIPNLIKLREMVGKDLFKDKKEAYITAIKNRITAQIEYQKKFVDNHTQEKTETVGPATLQLSQKIASTEVGKIVDSQVIDGKSIVLGKSRKGVVIQEKGDWLKNVRNGLFISNNGEVQFDGDLSHIKMLVKFLSPMAENSQKILDIEGEKFVIAKTRNGTVVQSEKDYVAGKRNGVYIGNDDKVVMDNNRDYVTNCLKALAKEIGLLK